MTESKQRLISRTPVFGAHLSMSKLLHSQPGTVARVMRGIKLFGYRTPTCCLAYFADLHRLTN